MTYEANVVCDQCKAAEAGTTSTSALHARRSAIEVGAAKGWLIAIGPNGIGTHCLCAACLEKGKKPCNSNHRF